MIKFKINKVVRQNGRKLRLKQNYASQNYNTYNINFWMKYLMSISDIYSQNVVFLLGEKGKVVRVLKTN
jgi:hypothetical protein